MIRPDWNRKVVVSFGGSSGTQYIQGVMAPPTGSGAGSGVVNHAALSKGFGYLISSELVNGRRGNGVLQGETLMMIKEYIIERYGVPKFFIGSGGSGGAIQQLVITQMYPGLLDGLMPSLTFPDSSLHTIDSILLTNLWPKLDKTVWTQEKITAVEGFTPGTARAWNMAYGRLGVPTNAAGCALADKTLIFDPVTNPKGARCTTQDIRVNIYGRDPKTGWARRPTDNIGLQYGLAALNSGAISVDEFLDVNEKVGGTDIDGKVVAERTEGDAIALKNMYESGLKASYNAALGNVPILMSRIYTGQPRRHSRSPARLRGARAAAAGQRPFGQLGDLDCVDRRRDRRQPGHHERVAGCDDRGSGAAVDRQGGEAQAGGRRRYLLGCGGQQDRGAGQLRRRQQVQRDLSGAQRAAARGGRAADQRRDEVPAEADRLRRLQGDVHRGAEGPRQERVRAPASATSRSQAWHRSRSREPTRDTQGPESRFQRFRGFQDVPGVSFWMRLHRFEATEPLNRIANDAFGTSWNPWNPWNHRSRRGDRVAGAQRSVHGQAARLRRLLERVTDREQPRFAERRAEERDADRQIFGAESGGHDQIRETRQVGEIAAVGRGAAGRIRRRVDALRPARCVG